MPCRIPSTCIYRVTGVPFWESAKALNAGIELDDRGVPAKLTALPMYFLASHAAELFADLDAWRVAQSERLQDLL